MDALLSNPQFVAVMIALLSSIALLIKAQATALDNTRRIKQTQKATLDNTEHIKQTKDIVQNGDMANQIARGIGIWLENEKKNPSSDLMELHKRLHER